MNIPIPFYGRLHTTENNKLVVTNDIGSADQRFTVSAEVGTVKIDPDFHRMLGEIVGCKPDPQGGWVVWLKSQPQPNTTQTNATTRRRNT